MDYAPYGYTGSKQISQFKAVAEWQTCVVVQAVSCHQAVLEVRAAAVHCGSPL